MKKASIIIPLYNSDEYIGQILEFLTKHNAAFDTEIIVVNDGSTDNSKKEALKYREFIKLVDLEKNCGRSVARNRGIALAEGEILIFLDADCIPRDKDFFRLHLDFHEKYNGALNGQVIFAPFHYGENKYFNYRHAELSSQGLKEIESVHFATGNVSVKKAAIVRVGGFDEKMSLFEDVDMGLRLDERDFKFYKDDRIVVYHLDTKINLERDMKRNYIAFDESVKRILAKNSDFFQKIKILHDFEKNRRSSQHFYYRYIFKYLYYLYKIFEDKLTQRHADRIFSFLTIASAYNGYYGFNKKFFDKLLQ